jgi:hypothetical protein
VSSSINPRPQVYLLGEGFHLRPIFFQVYFALDVKSDHVKIGRTRSYLADRLRGLVSTYELAEDPKLLYAFSTFNQSAETSIHLLLREYLIQGEWYLNGPHIQIAVALWLQHGPSVENLRIVDRTIVSRTTGNVVGQYVSASADPQTDIKPMAVRQTRFNSMARATARRCR